MAPCSNNEILKASVTYNHTTHQKGKEKKKKGKKGEPERKNASVLISYKLEFKKLSLSLGRL